MKRIDFRDLQKYLHEIRSQSDSDDLIKKIYSMDAHTVYALLQGYLAPLLSQPSESKSIHQPLLFNQRPNLNFSSVLENTEIKGNATIAHLQSLENLFKSLISRKKSIDSLIKRFLEKERSLTKLSPSDALEYIGRLVDKEVTRFENDVKSIRKILNDMPNSFLTRSLKEKLDSKVYEERLDIRSGQYGIFEYIISGGRGARATNWKESWRKYSDILKERLNIVREMKAVLLSELEARIAKLREEKEQIIGDLKDKITGLENKEKNNESRIAELEKQIDNLEGAKNVDKETIREKNVEIKKLKEKLSELTKDKDKTIKEKETANDLLERQIKEKDTKISDLEKEIEEMRENIKNQGDLEEKIAELKREKEELEESKGGQITNLKERLEKLEEEIAKLEKLKDLEIKELKKDLKKVQKDLEEREKEIKDTKIDEMAKELPDLQKVLKELEDGGNNLEDLSKLRDKLDELNRLTKNGKDAVNDLADLQKNIKELREELQKQKIIELERQKKEKEIADRENKLDYLQREILKLRRELNDLESLKGKDLTDLREKLGQLEKLQKEVGDSNDKVKGLEEEINRLRKELIKDKQEELDRQKEVSDREKEIERLKKEKEIEKIREIELEELKKKQGMMDAYVFMIVVFLTQLHTKQAEKLKAHGETLKKVSMIFDQWNVIQRGLNTISQNATVILGWIKEGKVDSNYNLFTDSTLSKKESDSDKLAIWNAFKFFLSNLQNNVKKLRKILDEVRPNLPDSAKTLLDTMYKLSEKLLDIPEGKRDNDLTSYLKVTTESEAEKRISREIKALKEANKNLVKDADKLSDEMAEIRDDIGEVRWGLTDGALEFFWPSYYTKKQTWNEKYRERSRLYKQIEANKKTIQEKESELRKELRQKIALPDKRLTILEWVTDSDQTQFKTYMDNLAQGITALTSISNMVQQQLQIDTQYYNSLLGLQKAGMDSLTKTIQGILANMRS